MVFWLVSPSLVLHSYPRLPISRFPPCSNKSDSLLPNCECSHTLPLINLLIVCHQFIQTPQHGLPSLNMTCNLPIHLISYYLHSSHVLFAYATGLAFCLKSDMLITVSGHPLANSLHRACYPLEVSSAACFSSRRSQIIRNLPRDDSPDCLRDEISWEIGITGKWTPDVYHITVPPYSCL